MAYTWEKDADDIHRAFAKFSADKAVLIGKIENENDLLNWKMKNENNCCTIVNIVLMIYVFL